MAGSSRKVEIPLANFEGTPITCITNGKTEVTFKKSSVYVLEMEDVCYHEKSALLLPDNPSGAKEGSTSSNEQKRLGGVAVLALVFRQFQEDPTKRLLIAGHDDTIGNAKDSFIISRERAKGVLYLLRGDEMRWVTHAFSNHTIKDYQQIMKYFHYEKGWDCDPGDIDGVWGRRTERATQIFFESLEKSGYCKKKPQKEAVIASAWKKWPIEAWAGVYAFYEELIFSLLIGARWTREDAAAARQKISFVDSEFPFVACGESFPIDSLGKDNYSSQKNRRVEFLFFAQKEHPPLSLKCPAQTNKVHTKEECPIYNLAYYTRIYIKPDDINTVLYHLKFEYYDRIKEDWCVVPEGLQLNAYKDRKLCKVSNIYKNGLYKIRIFNIPDGKREDDIHFVFKTKNAWIYTKDKDTPPRIVYTFADVDPSLPNRPITRQELWKRPLSERVHYYDLPESWDSRNWYCRIDQKEGYFKELCKEITSTTAPMVFCLDDIVLVDDKSGSQEIKDKDEHNNPKNLDGDSRVSLFYVKAGKLELYSPENPDAPYFSKIPFSRNLIHTPPGNTVVIAFANGFYPVSNLRAEEQCDISKGQLVGCRIAKKNDSSVHFGEVLDYVNNTFGHLLFFAKDTGNFELHYFHDAGLVKKEGKEIPRSFLLIYWSARFTSNQEYPVTPEQIKTFATKGMQNAKLRWEDKGYTIEPVSNNEKREIVPVFFFETKKPHSGGEAKCLVTVSSNPKTGWMSNKESDMYWEDYNVRDYLGVGNYKDIDGKSYFPLVVAHEYGHATGKDDEYAYIKGDINVSEWNDKDGPFSQWYFGMPYDIDKGSMMVNNRAPRMRQFWFFVNWLNDCSERADKLGKFLNGEQYKIVYRYGTKQLNYYLPKRPKDFRNIYAPGDPAYLDRNVNTGTCTFGVALYKIGEDETAYKLKVPGRKSVEPWDSICVVFIKIGVTFGYNKTPGGSNDYVYRANGTPKLWEDVIEIINGEEITIFLDYYRKFNKALDNIRNRFWAEDTKNSKSYFRNIYIYFFPIVLPDPFWYPDSKDNLLKSIDLKQFTNIDIIVHLNDSAKIVTREGKTLKVGNKTSPSWIVRYIFGRDDGDKEPKGTFPVDKSDMYFLQEWLRDKLNSPTLCLKGV